MTAAGDDHTLGLSLAELCLREAGWATRWVGRRAPIDQAVDYIGEGHARLVAVSASRSRPTPSRSPPRPRASAPRAACREPS
jgi:methanogenic corrinoid protein MtbC1